MLYLRTGSNGSCKTLFTLKDVRTLQLETKRPVAFNRRFKAKPILTDEFGWKAIDFKDWQAEPDGTIFLVDECHNDMPLRPNGSTVPDHIRMLAEHRSRGFDFFFLTQHPANIDVFPRKLIGAPGWHQHLKRVFGASNITRVLQWDAVNMNCEKDGSGKQAQITTRAQPKEVYDWYDSATLHTGKKRIPKQVYFFVGGLLLAVVFGWIAVQKLMSMGDRGKVADTPGKPAAMAPAALPVSGSGSDRAEPMSMVDYVASFQPRIPGLPHTAPRYDTVNVPVQAPKPAACVDGTKPGARAKTCQCWSQQATLLQVPPDLCRQIAAGGFFDDTQQPPDQKAARDRSAASVMASFTAGDGVTSAAQITAGTVLPPPDTKSTIARDSEVMAFLAKRRQAGAAQ